MGTATDLQTLLELILLGCLATAPAVWFYLRPKGAIVFAVRALIAAMTLPFILAFLLDPFVGSGAGLGVALMLYALAGFLVWTALAAFAGAGLRAGLQLAGSLLR
jgi:hypothetical protein